jgi:hypothetical protein
VGIINCAGQNAVGEPCGKPATLVGSDGYCDSHRPGGSEYMSEIGRLGAAATNAKHSMDGFEPGELPAVVDYESAKVVLDMLAHAVVERRITHSECSAATRAVDAWVRAEGANLTSRLVQELKSELDAKEREIAALRKQLASPRLRAS